jgi:membrane protein required for colicin V production
MVSLGDITSFDVVVVVLFLLFTVRGAWVGFLRQVSFFLALVFSYLFAGEYTGSLMPYVDRFIENPKFVFFISFLVLFMAGGFIFILLGKVLHLVMQLTLAGWFDRVLGFLLGLVKAVLVASFLFMIMSSGPSSAHELVHKSVTAQFLARGAAFIQRYIQDAELREKFMPSTPAIPPEEKTEEEEPAKNGPPADDRQVSPGFLFFQETPQENR